MRGGFTKCAAGFYPIESRKRHIQQVLPVDSHARGLSIISTLAILYVLYEFVARSKPGPRRKKYLQVHPHFSGLSFLLDFDDTVGFCFD